MQHVFYFIWSLFLLSNFTYRIAMYIQVTDDLWNVLNMRWRVYDGTCGHASVFNFWTIMDVVHSLWHFIVFLISFFFFLFSGKYKSWNICVVVNCGSYQYFHSPADKLKTIQIKLTIRFLIAFQNYYTQRSRTNLCWLI